MNSRRDFLRWAGLACGAAVTGCMPGQAGDAARDDKKGRLNVLLIVSEDNGPQLSCYGDKYIKTPNLDRIGHKGVIFEQAYVTQAGCSPSRSTILTGLYPHQNGQLGLATHSFRMYDPKTATLPNMLKSAGYRTGRIGKLHVNPESAFAFDFNWNEMGFKNRPVQTVADKAEEFITGGAGPFFLMVNYPDAHYPYLKEQYGLPTEPLGPEDVAVPAFMGHNDPKILKVIARYYNCMQRLDAGVGMLMERLAKTGHADDTLVIYLGDHGPEFERGKMTCYEGGVRIPLLLAGPGVPTGQRNDELVSTVDLVPTILAAAGVKAGKDLPGGSLLKLVNGDRSGWRQELYTEFTVHWPETYYPQRAVRDRQYKLIHNLLPGRESTVAELYKNVKRGGYPSPAELEKPKVKDIYERWHNPPEYELYDLKRDPWEYENLSERAEFVPVLMKLQKKLETWQKETDDPLRDAKKLEMLTKENYSLFEDGEYKRQPDYQWQYPHYFGKEN